jgi:hypothetical protein
MDNFPEAVRKAVGAGVPCGRPFTDIELLQLIDHGNIERFGLFRRKHVLVNIGDRVDSLVNYVKLLGPKGTLIDNVDDEHHREDRYLEELVAKPEYAEFNVNPLNVKQCAALKTAFNASISLKNGDLAKVGFKATSDRNWTLSLVNGRITKKFVSVTKLEDFLVKNSIPWWSVMSEFKSVVTAIYYVTGGLKYIGDSESVTTAAMKLDPTKQPVKIMDADGWEYTVNDVGLVALSEINPREWIIAIEYEDLEVCMG